MEQLPKLSAAEMAQMTPDERAMAIRKWQFQSLDQLDPTFRERVEEAGRRLPEERGLLDIEQAGHVRVTGTPPHVQRRLTAIYSAMTGAERVALAADMANEAKAIAVAGIRARHHELSDSQVATEWICLLHGDEPADHVTWWSSKS